MHQLSRELASFPLGLFSYNFETFPSFIMSGKTPLSSALILAPPFVVAGPSVFVAEDR